MAYQAITISFFYDREIKRIFLDNEWWFNVIDVCNALSESQDLDGSYWRKVKHRLIKENKNNMELCRQIKMKAQDGKLRKMDCANIEGIFRIIQSIPSKRAEPLKL